jgi:hypothetical protein
MASSSTVACRIFGRSHVESGATSGTPNASYWTKEEAERACGELMRFVTEQSKDYLWHRDAWVLRVQHVAELAGFALVSQTYFGDCIDDEWFVAYLLFELSRRHPELTCTIGDDDGDILLIEAAAYLPKWLTPDKAENRIFVREGSLHILPLPTSPAEIGVYPVTTPTLAQALPLLSTSTLAAQPIQRALQTRIGQYPAKAVENLHHARALLPESAAKVLLASPTLIAPAVAAFYERDPIDMRACAKMELFSPATRVAAPVTLTRLMYAQLKSQVFQAGKLFGSPPSSAASDVGAHDLGVKIACGLEILANFGRKRRTGPLTEEQLAEHGPWHAYVKRLSVAGYFRDNIEGSKQYRELLHIAQQKYLDHHNDQAQNGDDEESRPTWSLSEAGERVLAVLAAVRDQVGLPPHLALVCIA